LERPLEAAKPLLDQDQERLQEWRKHGQPKLADILHEIHLDVVYQSGSGAYLEYEHPTRGRVRVLDLLSGYGAGLLGHQPPALVEIARASLDEGLSLNTQASCRPWSSLLCTKLSHLLREATTQDYVVHLLNTGSESVEAAIRHAELLRRGNRDTLLRQLQTRTKALENSWSRMTVHEQDELRARACKAWQEAGLAVPAHWTKEDSIDLPEFLFAQGATFLKANPVFFALEESYHGSGCGAAKLSHGERYRKGLESIGLDVRFVPPAEPECLANALKELQLSILVPRLRKSGQWDFRVSRVQRGCALFLEVIQGEGGIRPVPTDSLQRLASLAQEHGVSLIVDEIQTGLGRTGALFAFPSHELRPDIVLLSKVLGGGMVKVAACAIAKNQYCDDFSLQHMSTFAGDDASSRMACGVLELLTDESRGLLERVRMLGEELLAGLRQIQMRYPQAIQAVRGCGLMLGMELASQAESSSPTLRALDETDALGLVACGWLLHEENLRVAPATRQARTLRIQPSLCLDHADVNSVLAGIEGLCQILAQGDAAKLTRFVHQNGKVSSAPQEVLDAQHREAAAQDQAPDLYQGTSYVTKHTWSEHPQPEIPRVAFLGHPIDVESMRGFDPALAELSDEALQRMFGGRAGQPESYPQRRFRIRSLTGDEVDAVVFSWQLLPQAWMQARHDRALRSRLVKSIEETLDQVQAAGCEVAGFGAYTSILTGACTEVRRQNLSVTSGNGLTAGIADRALRQACEQQGMDLSMQPIAVVGATGNIGLVHAQLLAPDVQQLTLIGPPGSEPRLAAIRQELEADPSCRAQIHCSTDPARIRACPIVVSATNVPKPLFGADDFAPGPGVFLDVSVPSDLKVGAVTARPDIRFLQGGIIRLPHGAEETSRLELPGWQLPTGYSYACLAETLLLGLDCARPDYSCGPLAVNDVLEMLALADRHGFQVGMLPTPERK